MPCPRTDIELNAYFDGELSPLESAAFEGHLHTCPDCQAAQADFLKLREAMRNPSLYHRAPRELTFKINSDIAGLSPETHIEQPRSRSTRNLSVFALATAAAACLALAIVLLQTRNHADDLLAEELVSNHVRSMMATHLLDVPSLDRHTVKPWFDGKIDFAPPVIDTSAEGFPLIGGRLDYLLDRPVAALVFKRQQHVINLFVWKSGSSPDEANRVLTRQGYNLVHWTHAGMTFWAVSDLELPQLQQFAEAQQRPPGS